MEFFKKKGDSKKSNVEPPATTQVQQPAKDASRPAMVPTIKQEVVTNHPAVEKIINAIADLVPEARGHVGTNFRKLHDEIKKLLPAAETIVKEAPADVKKVQGLLNDAQKQIEELTNKVASLEVQLKDKPAEILPASDDSAAPASAG